MSRHESLRLIRSVMGEGSGKPEHGSVLPELSEELGGSVVEGLTLDLEVGVRASLCCVL